jgi:hypothetical protein
VRVEEVRGAVERDCGLAGARAARDHEDAGDLGPDGLVLFGLDGCDDVAHSAGAVAFERGEQRAFARDLEAGIGDRALVEDFVVKAGDLAALLGDDVPAAHHCHRCDRGGAVEGFGDRRAPVDHERCVRFVLDREAPDVPARRVFHVEPTEHEGRVGDVEVGQAPLGHIPGDVPLEPGLVRPARADVRVRGADPFGRRPHGLQPGVRGVHVALFGREFGILSALLGQPSPLLVRIRLGDSSGRPRSVRGDGPA